MDRTGPDSDIDDALHRAALYGACALAFGPPDEEVVKLASPEGTEALSELLAALGICGDGVSALPAPSAEAFAKLFGHTVRGDVPAYETEYGEETLFAQPRELADLAGFFRAFGLTPLPSIADRVDHIRYECEFMGFLARKEAHATEIGDDAMREETVKAQRLFLRDHLGRFAPAFAERLCRGDRTGFYAAMVRMLRDLVARDCERLEVPLGRATLPLRPQPAEPPMGCGDGASGEGCASAGGCP